MVSEDRSDTSRVVQNYTLESAAYLKQLQIWLGVASAGGAISFASLAASLPNPGYAFHFLLVSLWMFLVSMVAAGFSVFALAMRAASLGDHHASSHNRNELNDAIRSTPESFSAPPSLSEPMNKKRNSMIDKSIVEHQRAERAWITQSRWKMAWKVSLLISAISFTFGFSWPLARLTWYSENLVPK